MPRSYSAARIYTLSANKIYKFSCVRLPLMLTVMCPAPTHADSHVSVSHSCWQSCVRRPIMLKVMYPSLTHADRVMSLAPTHADRVIRPAPTHAARVMCLAPTHAARVMRLAPTHATRVIRFIVQARHPTRVRSTINDFHSLQFNALQQLNLINYRG